MAMFRCGGEVPKPYLFLQKNGGNIAPRPSGVYSPDGINVYYIRWELDIRFTPDVSKTLTGIGSLRYIHNDAYPVRVTLSTRCYVKGSPTLSDGVYPVGTEVMWKPTPPTYPSEGIRDTRFCADWQNCPCLEIRAL